ncbi:MAG: sensor domain-containing diguanylate cyclase, partial [Solirubrobacterales bacterium]|nr:sensor domain-containing diguanylate cyclase [Solirubrobacterales bacterium]
MGAVAELSSRGFADFPEATRAILATLERQLDASAVIVGYFDLPTDRYWVIDSAGDESFGLEAGVNIPLQESFCIYMADERAPQLANRVDDEPIYREITARAGSNIASYVGVPLEVSSGERVGSLCAISHSTDAYSESDRQLLLVIAKLLAYELEREHAAQKLTALTEQLREQATTDALTGLLNRRAFNESLEREWELTRRDGIPSHVVVADLDRFKELNDRCGHAAGDDALRAFVAALRSIARDTDILGRLGGDEFGIVLVRAHDPEGPERFMRRFREACISLPAGLGVSLGAAALADGSSPAAILELADQRMYEDKRARRQR